MTGLCLPECSLSVGGLLNTDAFVIGQALNWLPSFLVPIWCLAIGLSIGGVAAALFYAVLSGLSFIPPLGKLADSPRRGITVSLIVGGLIAAVLCVLYVPHASDPEFAHLLILPLITLGVLMGFAIVYGMWHRTRSEWNLMPSEGINPYLLSVAGVVVLIGLASTPLVTSPLEFFRSMKAVHLVGDGTSSFDVTVPGNREEDPDTAAFNPANKPYSLLNLSELTIESDKNILIADAANPASFSRLPVTVNASESFVYRSSGMGQTPIPGDPTRLFLQNREIDPATVKFTFKTLPDIPEVSSIIGLAIAFFLLISFMMAFRQAAPRVWALAISTAKNEMGQPLFLLLLSMGLFGVVLFGFFPFNTLGDDIRLLKDCGITLIMVLGMMQAVWSAGTSVSEEIEGRTALTVLCKPVSRRSFLLGKYSGIMMTVAVLFAIVAAVLLIVISYKVLYDARESTRAATTWQQSYDQVITTLPILGLYFMQTMAIAAVAVALATRLPLLANFIACFVVYIIGNLTSPLVQAAEGNNELVGFVGKLIAVVVPNLNIFSAQAAIDAAKPIPAILLPGAFNYLVCFIIAAWMIAMLFFEDRDLA